MLRLIAMVYLAAGFWLFAPASGGAAEPIAPLPQTVEYDRAKALLGKRLFFDTRLSSDGMVSCATCHDLDRGGAESRPVSTGVYRRADTINAPTVFNAVFNFRQFWNGRARNLKEQAIGPIHNPREMDMSFRELEEMLNRDPGYRADFSQVYGTERVRAEDAVDAIVEFEAALITPNAKIDRYLRGEVALDDDEKAGYLLFKSFGCASCHNGINIGGNSFQYLGAVMPFTEPTAAGDRFAISGDPFDRNRFKVPSLRNVALTAPYLHDGSIPTLADVLDTMSYHNLGFRLSADEKRRLLAFLYTLTGERPAILDRS